MEKEEMIETFAKSREKILNSADFKISAERFLKSRMTVYGPLLKKLEDDMSISWKKVGNEKQFKLNDSLKAKFDSAIDKKKFDKAK